MAKQFGLIPQEIIERIRDKADLVQFVSRYVTLRKAGKNFLGRCPFHQEQKPSFTVNPVTQFFHCYGCGKGGTVFNFFMFYNNISYPEAVRYIAEQVGVTIPQAKRSKREQAEDRKKQTEVDQLSSLNKEVAQYFMSLLWTKQAGLAGRDYISERKISKSVARTFLLGLSPPPWDELYRYLSQKGFTKELLLKSGLLIQKEDTKKIYDRFRTRFMFPFFDKQGRILGFAGRTLADEDAKYINSPETVLYKKRNVLYGLYQAAEHIRRERSVLIVEGYFDLLTLYQHGIKNVVATCGTALTEDHVNILRRYSRNIQLVFDGDKAGIQAAFRSIDMMLGRDLDLSVCPIVGSKDPDDYVNTFGIKAFQEIQKKAMAPFPFLLTFAREGKDLSSHEGLIQYLDEISPFVLKITDPVKQSLIISQIAEIAKIDNQDLLDRYKIQIRKGRQDPITIEKQKSYPDFELYLLRLLLHNPGKIGQYNEELVDLSLQNNHMNEFLKTVLSLWQQEEITEAHQWIEAWGVLPYQKQVTRICTEPAVEENVDKEIRGAILKIRTRSTELERKECLKRLQRAQSQKDEEQILSLTQKIAELSLRIQENQMDLHKLHKQVR